MRNDRGTPELDTLWVHLDHCPEHPDARIWHMWDEEQCFVKGCPVGDRTIHDHRYVCAVCGRRLAGKPSVPND